MSKFQEYLTKHRYELEEPSGFRDLKSRPISDTEGFRSLIDLILDDLIGSGPKNLFFVHGDHVYAQFFPGQFASSKKPRVEIRLEDFVAGELMANKQRMFYGRPLHVSIETMKQYAKNREKIDEFMDAISEEERAAEEIPSISQYLDEIRKHVDRRTDDR